MGCEGFGSVGVRVAVRDNEGPLLPNGNGLTDVGTGHHSTPWDRNDHRGLYRKANAPSFTMRIGIHIRNTLFVCAGGKGSGTREWARVDASDLQVMPLAKDANRVSLVRRDLRDGQIRPSRATQAA
jgi:hypothetical protein